MGVFIKIVSHEKKAMHKLEFVADMPWIGPNDRGSTFAFCSVCSSHISVSSGERNVAVYHAGSAAHGKQQTAIAEARQPQMRSYFVSSKATEFSTKGTTAEVRFAHSPKKTSWNYSISNGAW